MLRQDWWYNRLCLSWDKNPASFAFIQGMIKINKYIFVIWNRAVNPKWLAWQMIRPVLIIWDLYIKLDYIPWHLRTFRVLLCFGVFCWIYIYPVLSLIDGMFYLRHYTLHADGVNPPCNQTAILVTHTIYQAANKLATIPCISISVKVKLCWSQEDLITSIMTRVLWAVHGNCFTYYSLKT